MSDLPEKKIVYLFVSILKNVSSLAWRDGFIVIAVSGKE